jgi:hypothetical protein
MVFYFQGSWDALLTRGTDFLAVHINQTQVIHMSGFFLPVSDHLIGLATSAPFNTHFFSVARVKKCTKQIETLKMYAQL